MESHPLPALVEFISKRAASSIPWTSSMCVAGDGWRPWKDEETKRSTKALFGRDWYPAHATAEQQGGAASRSLGPCAGPAPGSFPTAATVMAESLP